ncbi:hypothetical protein BBP40_011795 [Aspergillus hancockii]|nr:hypothetical protein BBP40_011795 [Aspergillus hancockii]
MFVFLDNKGDHLGYMSSTNTLIPVMVVPAAMPSYVRTLFMLGGLLFSRTRKSLVALNSLTKAADSAVNDRLYDADTEDKKPQRPDLLGKIMKIYHERRGELDFDIEDVKIEAFGAFFAGSDTTAITLTGILYHIIKNNSVFETLRGEVPVSGFIQRSGRNISRRRIEDMYGEARKSEPTLTSIMISNSHRSQVVTCDIYKVIPQIIRSCHLELVMPGEKLKTTAYWFYKPDAVHIKIQRRG